MAEKNGYRRFGVEALTARKSDVETRKAQAEAHISDQLNTFTLGGTEAASAENVSTISNPIHIQDSNFSQLETMNTINEALFRSDGGPIPGTGVCVSAEVSDDSRTTLWTPNPGETWVLNSVSAEVTNISGSLTYTFFMYDQVNPGNMVRWFYYASTGASPIFQSDADFPDMPMYFDENIIFQFTVTGAGSFDTVDMNACIFRIR